MRRRLPNVPDYLRGFKPCPHCGARVAAHRMRDGTFIRCPQWPDTDPPPESVFNYGEG